MCIILFVLQAMIVTLIAAVGVKLAVRYYQKNFSGIEDVTSVHNWQNCTALAGIALTGLYCFSLITVVPN